MKLLHLADLHFGKRIDNLSLKEDQEYMVKQILSVIDSQQVEGVLIAGDVYDKPLPSEEAVNQFDNFLNELSNRKLKVFIIAGNHDSADRLSFGNKLISKNEIYIASAYKGVVEPITIQDEYGDLNIYLLPFIKPVHVKRYYSDENINNYTDAIKVAINHMNIDTSKRNIILSHQFVTGASGDGSEELSLGGMDNVDSDAYDGFDYVALGHIHRPQNVKGKYMRYSGTCMKYSFSEEKQTKTFTIVDLKEKGNIEVNINLEINLLRDFKTIRGNYNDIISNKEEIKDFVHIVLTDEDDIANAFNNLSMKYENLLSISYDNKRTNNQNTLTGQEIDRDLSPMELFSEFYQNRNNQELSQEQIEYLNGVISTIWEDQ